MTIVKAYPISFSFDDTTFGVSGDSWLAWELKRMGKLKELDKNGYGMIIIDKEDLEHLRDEFQDKMWEIRENESIHDIEETLLKIEEDMKKNTPEEMAIHYYCF